MRMMGADSILEFPFPFTGWGEAMRETKVAFQGGGTSVSHTLASSYRIGGRVCNRGGGGAYPWLVVVTVRWNFRSSNALLVSCVVCVAF